LAELGANLKIIISLIIFVSLSVEASSYKAACSNAVYSIITFKITNHIRSRNLGNIDAKYEVLKNNITQKYGKSKSEKTDKELKTLSKMKRDEMEQGRWLYPHSLCDDKDILDGIKSRKATSKTHVDVCLSTKGRSIFDFDIYSTDKKTEGDKTAKDLEIKISEKVQEAYQGIDGISRCNPQNAYKNRKAFYKEKNSKTSCEIILNDINAANKVARVCLNF
jgi:hypothetical protein